MTYVVKDNERKYWLQFDRFVRDMSIITTVEPVNNIHSATEFDDECIAKRMIKEVDNTGIDTSNYMILNKEEVLEEQQKKAEEQSKEVLKNAWSNTSEQGKLKRLKEILNTNGEDAVKEFLETVDDKSGITIDDIKNAKEHPLIETVYANFEKILGRQLTDEEKETLSKGE